jgi:hypothetical protein
LAEHLGRHILGFLGGVDDVDATLVAVLEGAFATATGVDLGLYDKAGATEVAGDLPGFFRVVATFPLGVGTPNFSNSSLA